MPARFDLSSPFPSAQKPVPNALLPDSQSSAPPSSHFAHSPTRSLSLPTPSPSPSSCSEVSSTSSSSSSSNMLSFGSQSDILDPFVRRMQHHLSLSQPPSPPSFEHPHLIRHRPHQLSCPTPPQEFFPRTEQIIDLRYDLDTERLHSTTGSLSGLAQKQYEEFRRSKSRVIRLFNLPRSSTAAANIISSLFSPANNLTTPTSSSPYRSSFLDLASVRMWTLREEYGGDRAGEESSVWMVFPTHAEACSALSMSGPLSVAAALESDLEPFEKLRKYEMNDATLNSSMLKDLFPPSPTSPDCPAFSLPEGTAPFARYEPMQQRPYQLSSNPPNPRSAFRHGDWICASPTCAAHNFGRNIVCIGCGSPRILCDAQSQSSDGSFNGQFLSRVASPRFAGGSPAFSMPSPSPSALGLANGSIFQQQQQASKQTALTHQLLTPSGRALALGGKVQNVSKDPLAPCIVYWPDNEPLPEQGQIRPAAASQVHQPPIMNTGNKGPIEHQPGDWICHKCEYLNWRRRKVCQTCYPFAEGNGDSVSAAMQAERLAYLAGIFAQNQAASHLNATTAPSALANNNHSFPRSSATVPFPSAIQRPNMVPHHHQLGQQQQQPMRFPTNTRMSSTNQAFTRRSNSTPEMPSGNVVYQTPISPSRANFALMSDAGANAGGAQTGHLLPSFLKNEIKPVSVRTPLSLSPSSSSSAELSYDEYDDELNSPGSVIGSASTFYAQQKTGSGKLSSGSGSSSSLTLGGSIWALDRDEDKSWNNVALPSPDYLAGAMRNCKLEPLKNL